MDTLRILITGAGAPGIRGTLYSLRNNWERRKLSTIGVDMRSEVVGKYLCDKFHHIPPGKDESFISTLLDICKKDQVDVVLPQVTSELFPLAKHKRNFEKIGTVVAVSNLDTLNTTNNKYRLLETANELGVPHPRFFLVKNWERLERAAEKLGYPFVVKPPVASGMRGLRIIHRSLDRKKAFYEEKPDSSIITVEELHTILGENFPELVAMDFLPGKEYSVDVLSSKQRIYAVVPRSRDMIRTGITFNGTVQKRDDIIESSQRIVAETGLEFACGLQFRDDCEGVPKIIESNPRIQGTMVLSTLAGANIIYGAVKLALNEDVPEFSIRWGTKLFRYWGGIGKNGKVFEI